MKHKRYRQVKVTSPTAWSKWDGIPKPGLIVACCDCGLVHHLKFAIIDTRVHKQVYDPKLILGYKMKMMTKMTRERRKQKNVKARLRTLANVHG